MQLGSVVGAIFRLFNFIHQYQVILSLFNQIFNYYYYYYYYYSLVDTTNFWMIFGVKKKKKKQNREKKKCAYLALVVVSPLQ
jgi:hypothetical protein